MTRQTRAFVSCRGRRRGGSTIFCDAAMSRWTQYDSSFLGLGSAAHTLRHATPGVKT